jgi:hypothetical protein
MKDLIRGAMIIGAVVVGFNVLEWYIDKPAPTAADITKNCVTFNSRGLMDSTPCSNGATVGGLEALDEAHMEQFKLIKTCLDDHEDYAGFRRCLH